MAICSYLTTFKPPLSVWNIGKHCHLHWKIPCKVDHVLVFIHPYFRYSQGIAFQCNTQVWQVRLVSSFQMSNSRTGQYFYFTSTLPGLDQEERMSGKVAYFFKLYAFLLKCSHFWSPYSFTRWTAMTSTFPSYISWANDNFLIPLISTVCSPITSPGEQRNILSYFYFAIIINRTAHQFPVARHSEQLQYSKENWYMPPNSLIRS